MDTKKLFHALVIGGALLAAGCESETSREPDAATPEDARAPLADAALADTGVPSPNAGDAGLMECGFCPNEECCETAEDGTSRERDGLVCCWGTSC